jgi:fumarate reductase subunit D
MYEVITLLVFSLVGKVLVFVLGYLSVFGIIKKVEHGQQMKHLL